MGNISLARIGVFVIIALLLSGCLTRNQDQVAIEKNIVSMQAATNPDMLLIHFADPIELEIIWNSNGERKNSKSIHLAKWQMRLGYFGGNVVGNLISQLSQQEDGTRMITVEGNYAETTGIYDQRLGIIRDDELLVGQDVSTIVQTFWQKVNEEWLIFKIQITLDIQTVIDF